MAKVNVPAVTPSVTLSPLARFVRTALQTIIAFGVSFPVLIGVFGFTATTTAKVTSVVAGIVVVASAIQNTLEHFNVLPTMGAKAPTSTK